MEMDDRFFCKNKETPMTRFSFSVAVAMLSGFALVGCDDDKNKTPAGSSPPSAKTEDLTKKAEDAKANADAKTTEAKDAVKDAAEKTEEAKKSAAEDIKKEADATSDAAKQKANAAEDALKDATKK
jgi:hypothetical protein